jgi:hypothetical protein
MVIFDERNVQIILRDGKYYLRIDVGHFCPEFTEIEVSKEDAEKVMQDVMYSSKVVLDYQNKRRGLV